jgi:aerobic C4-dicarboxylate transport protein
VLTSKGASGVQGASFIALVATMTVIPTIPVAGMALILGIDRFLSMFRAAVNMIGNGVATVVVARWEKEFGRDRLRSNFLEKENDSADTALGIGNCIKPALRRIPAVQLPREPRRPTVMLKNFGTSIEEVVKNKA